MNYRPPNLLSSSRFPMVASELSIGDVRSSFEYIYSNFTKRGLSQPKDRRYALGGLEQRLKEHYKCETTYGIVHCCLQSSLLWQRSGSRLQDIEDEEIKKIPSWSWMKYSGAVCYGTIPGFNTVLNCDIKIVPGKEPKLIETPLWRIRPLKEAAAESSSEGIKIAGHVLPSLPPIDRSPVTIDSFRFDGDDDDGFTINESQISKVQHLGFIVTATHTTNHSTKCNLEYDEFNSQSFGEISLISLKGDKPKKMSYALAVVSDSTTEEQDKSSEWRRIGVAMIDHDYLMLSESPRIVKVK